MFAIINLLGSSLMIGTSIIGIITIINKIGKFCKIIDENKVDGFKIGFDKLITEIIEDTNQCVESINSIANNSTKIFFILYDIVSGNKFIKKDKDGKIIICNKSKIFSSYKNKIDELSNKVKKYQEELFKFKKKKNKSSDSEEDEEDFSYSDVSSDSGDYEHLPIIQEIKNDNENDIE